MSIESGSPLSIVLYGEKMKIKPIEEIKASKIKPEFIKENIDKIINGNQTIHVIEERDR